MKYRVLVVDDESVIRKGLIAKLNTQSYLFSEIEEAENGEQALLKIRKNTPHLVITDIKMPTVGGIDLIRETIKMGLNIKFIIISGYNDFVYAKDAIEFGVAGYLLKPVNDVQFFEYIGKAVSELNEQYEIEKARNSQEQLTCFNRRINIERLINDVIYADKENILHITQEEILSTIGFTNRMILLASVRLNFDSQQEWEYSKTSIDLLKFAVENIAFELAERVGIEAHSLIVINDNSRIDQLLLLISGQNEDVIRLMAKEFVEQLYDNVVSLLKADISISVSSVERQIDSKIYGQMQQAYNLRLIENGKKIYYYEDLSRFDSTVKIPDEQLKLLTVYIDSGDYVNVELTLKNIFNSTNAANIKQTYYNVVYSLVNFLTKRGIEYIESSKMLAPNTLDQFSGVEQIIRFLYTSILQHMDVSVVNADCKAIVKNAREYIDKNYASNISVKSLCAMFGMNTSYFSTLFKQDTGESFSKYLARRRIEQACKMLEKTDASIVDIATTVGYSDIQYFYRVFKRVTEKTPLEYRTGYKHICV